MELEKNGNMINLDSSNIASVGYNRQDAVLFVKFRNGGVYSYSKVPEKIFLEIQRAPSAGKFFFANIKGKFEFKKIGKDENPVDSVTVFEQ